MRRGSRRAAGGRKADARRRARRGGPGRPWCRPDRLPPEARPGPEGGHGSSRACVDGSHTRAKKGGAGTGPSPVDRRKIGSKHHLICDGRGTPLKVITTAANVNDVT
ncbi:transposase [Streptomyces sp. CB02400]|uniref:transposase n=1 Tax=Streptomyces sp. CB02400 TaxID=1703944 RepID=UPI003FA7180D